MRPGDYVALEVLELRLRLFHGELLVSAGLQKHLPARRDAPKGAAWSHRFDIGIQELLGRVQVMCDDSLDELSCTSEPHRCNLVSATAIFKATRIAGVDAPVRSRREIEISAPPQVLWDVLTGFEQWPQWNPEVKSMSFDGRLAPESEFRWKAGPGTIVSTLEQVEPPRHVSWRGRTLWIKALHKWDLEPRDREPGP